MPRKRQAQQERQGFELAGEAARSAGDFPGKVGAQTSPLIGLGRWLALRMNCMHMADCFGCSLTVLTRFFRRGTRHDDDVKEMNSASLIGRCCIQKKTIRQLGRRSWEDHATKRSAQQW